MLPVSFQLLMALALLVGGTIACFAGYRLFRLVLGIFGFILGAMAAGSALGASAETTLTRTIIDSVYAGGFVILGGIAGAALFTVAYFVGVALVGAGVGAVVAHLVFGGRGQEPGVLILVFASIAGAVASTYLERYVVIIGTAWGGAWALIVAVMALWAPGPLVAGGRLWTVTPFSPGAGGRVQVVWIVLGLVGAAVQLGRTAGNKGRVGRRRKK